MQRSLHFSTIAYLNKMVNPICFCRIKKMINPLISFLRNVNSQVHVYKPAFCNVQRIFKYQSSIVKIIALLYNGEIK